MKVAVCIPLDLNKNGGVEKHILCLTKAMRSEGQDVDVFGTTDSACSAGRFQSLRKFRSQRYHIIHTHSGLFNPYLFSLIFNRLPQQRHVHTMHNVAMNYLFNCRDWLNWRCYWATLVEYMWCRWADHVICVSDNIRNWAMKHFQLIPETTTTILNGFSSGRRLDESCPQIREKLNIGPGDIALMFVGRGEDKVKGTDAITAALNRLYQKFPKIRLLAIPGSGFSDAPWLFRIGPVSHQEMPAYYSAADIFVNASLDEGMPLTVIEAMGLGLPVVAAPVGGIPDIITHNYNGLFTQSDRSDLSEQLSSLIEDSHLRKKLAQNAQSSVQEFTWEKLAKNTLDLYKSLLQPLKISGNKYQIHRK